MTARHMAHSCPRKNDWYGIRTVIILCPVPARIAVPGLIEVHSFPALASAVESGSDTLFE